MEWRALRDQMRESRMGWDRGWCEQKLAPVRRAYRVRTLARRRRHR